MRIGLALNEVQIASAWNIQCMRIAGLRVAERLFGIAVPDEPNTTAHHDTLTALWLGPASWLLISVVPLCDFAAKRRALNAAGGALFDVSAARAGWKIAGENAALLLGKACPLDFHPRIFPTGACAQSVFGHVNALYYRNGITTITMLVARSFARGVWRQLCAGAGQYGYDVAPAVAFGDRD